MSKLRTWDKLEKTKRFQWKRWTLTITLWKRTDHFLSEAEIAILDGYKTPPARGFIGFTDEDVQKSVGEVTPTLKYQV